MVHANGAEPSALALRQHLNDRLPPYMVPAAFVALDALPLSPNGKVDRKRLLQRRDVAVERDHAYVAPSSALERELAAIWQEVLHLEQVGLHDNFFDLGGSSLLVPQVLSKLNRRLDAKLAPIALFQHPSIAALASFLRQGAAPPPSQAHRAATTDARRTSRARQGERRKKLGP